jgi:acyl carrier protein
MSLRDDIVAEFEKVATEQNKSLVVLADELPLLEAGLDSLCFAIIVARLEESTGIDPFAAEEDVEFPVTFGEFVRVYDDAKT